MCLFVRIPVWLKIQKADQGTCCRGSWGGVFETNPRIGIAPGNPTKHLESQSWVYLETLHSNPTKPNIGSKPRPRTRRSPRRMKWYKRSLRVRRRETGKAAEAACDGWYAEMFFVVLKVDGWESKVSFSATHDSLMARSLSWHRRSTFHVPLFLFQDWELRGEGGLEESVSRWSFAKLERKPGGAPWSDDVGRSEGASFASLRVRTDGPVRWSSFFSFFS